MTYKIVEELQPNIGDEPPRPPVEKKHEKQPPPKPIGRLVSLDAYRGFIMILLAASGFGLGALARQPAESQLWKILDQERFERIAFHFDHPPWQSNFAIGSIDATEGSPWLRWKVSFWDLIQPAFMFMVGVAMPFSYKRREGLGHVPWKRTLHAAIRAIVLVLMGVFLYSLRSDSTNWIFTNVLAQIGLGYFFVYLLADRKPWIQWTALAAILVGSWIGIHVYQPPAIGEIDLDRETHTREDLLSQIWSAYDPDEVNANWEKGELLKPPYQQWSKNGNAFHYFDVWALNLVPRPEDDDPFLYNYGGYQTLNFVPAMATMILGLLCGQLMLSSVEPKRKLMYLIGGAVVCTSLGVLAGATCWPIVKRIWTPAWVLFSGGYVIGMLALFYLLFDIFPLRKLAFPLVVVGMNSIFVYMLGQLSRTWLADKVVQTHFGWAIDSLLVAIGTRFEAAERLGIETEQLGPILGELFAPVVTSLSAVIVIWLLCYWLYRRRIFIRI